MTSPNFETRRISVNEIQSNSFYQLPKFIVHTKEFKGLSSDSKILYALMRDRHQLSIKNSWVDEQGNVYMYYSRENICEDLNISIKTAVKIVNELKKYGLIEEVRQGLNKPNRIYVMSIDVDSQWTCKSYKSGVVNSTSQELSNLQPNKTNINKTNKNKEKDICSTGVERFISLYKSKKGISDKVREKIAKLIDKYGIEQLERGISRYEAYCKANESWYKKQYLSTYVNSGHVEYLDSNVEEVKQQEDELVLAELKDGTTRRVTREERKELIDRGLM